MHSYIQCDDSNNSNKGCILLKKGEAFVGSVDMYCINKPETDATLPLTTASVSKGTSAFPFESVDASMGDVMLHWRIDDSSLLLPLSLDKYQNETTTIASTNNNNWLLQFADNKIAMNNAITRSRICSMMFTVPAVKVC
jgi:hypothetical protein